MAYLFPPFMTYRKASEFREAAKVGILPKPDIKRTSRSVEFRILKGFYLFIFRGEGRENERERNIDGREKHQSVA